MPAVLSIIIGVVVLAACCGGKKQSGQKKVLRIDHPHYYDTQNEINENKEYVIDLLEMFAWWIDRQIENTSDEDMFVVFGP